MPTTTMKSQWKEKLRPELGDFLATFYFFFFFFFFELYIERAFQQQKAKMPAIL